jgi:pheromone receptor transcription factor
MDPATGTTTRKRARTNDSVVPAESGFVQDPEAGDSGGDDDEDEDGKPKDKKAGRRKIKIEFIQDKSRRHITFSKRKAGECFPSWCMPGGTHAESFTGIMKKAYELSTLTGTQVLLLVVSETGLVYTFTTAKLQPLVTQPEGKNLIQSCLNAPAGQPPSSMPVGQPLGRQSGPPPVNAPGGLTIGDDDGEEDSDGGERSKRARRSSDDGSADLHPATSAGSQGIPSPQQQHPARVSPIPPPQQQTPPVGSPSQAPPQLPAQQPQGARGPPGPYGGPPPPGGYHQDPNVYNMSYPNNPPGYWAGQQQQGMPPGQQYPRQ